MRMESTLFKASTYVFNFNSESKYNFLRKNGKLGLTFSRRERNTFPLSSAAPFNSRRLPGLRIARSGSESNEIFPQSGAADRNKMKKPKSSEEETVGKIENVLDIESEKVKISEEEISPAAAKKIAELESTNEELRMRVLELEGALSLARAEASFQILEEESELTQEPLQENQTEPEEPSLWKTIDWPSPEDPVPFWKRALATSSPPAGAQEKPPQDSDKMHVVHITAEMAPLAKVGGLADVVTGLSRACIARGHEVSVLLPFYECLDTSQVEGLSLQQTFGSYHRGNWIGVQAHAGKVSGVPVVFLRPENHFFKGGRIYGGSYNELEAYLFFGRASLEYLQVRSSTGAPQPSVLHLHEWHTGVVGLLYWDVYRQLGLSRPRLVLTIHNMEHQGECRAEELGWCGLDGDEYATVERCVDERTIGHNPERLSLLKGGIVYSNAVTTVSPTYVQETLCTGWLSATLHTHRSKYAGILNGIDTEMWDPMSDPLLPAHFSEGDLTGKALCKHYVQRGLGLELEVPLGGPPESVDGNGKQRRIPLVVCVTRLVAQKGIHLIRHAIFHTAQKGGQFVLLGSSPVGHIQADFERLAAEFKDSDNVRLVLTYSDALSHLLFAAGDLILVPSMFEPCGLTQMIGMRYGMVPVVRRTGGLADTVFDVDDERSGERKNGFVFDGIDEGSMESALDRALTYYAQRAEWWSALQMKVLGVDNSWNKSAGEYLDLYRSVRAQ